MGCRLLILHPLQNASSLYHLLVLHIIPFIRCKYRVVTNVSNYVLLFLESNDQSEIKVTPLRMRAKNFRVAV
jgi:hypothetical protein